MATLLQRISNGDADAVDECLKEYGGLVWRLAHRYLDRAKDEIDDAVQEVFLELWLHAKRFDPELGSEPAFVATLAHRRLIDYQRKVDSRRRGQRRVVAEVKPPAHLNGKGSAAGAHFEYAEVAEHFDLLPDGERRALWLAIHSGMTHLQISEAEEVPLGTVKTRLRRGLSRLRSALDRSPDSAAGKGSVS